MEEEKVRLHIHLRNEIISIDLSIDGFNTFDKNFKNEESVNTVTFSYENKKYTIPKNKIEYYETETLKDGF